jgi:Uma2 family endonuclease
MTTATATIPDLIHGQKLSREEYERRYQLLPDIRAELLDGVVYIMSSPISLDHAQPHAKLLTAMGLYSFQTEGIELLTTPTVRLGLSSDPEPDGVLFIREEYGGATHISADRYLEDSPELVFEIARTSQDYDERVKLPIYQRNGIREYLLWKVQEGVIDWYTLRSGIYVRLTPGTDGITRSEVFPGLWLDLEALLRQDSQRVLGVLMQGLQSQEHGSFLQSLQASRTSR